MKILTIHLFLFYATFLSLTIGVMSDVLRHGPSDEVDCSAVSCLRPECVGDMYVPEGECCPRCKVDCRTVRCYMPECEGDIYVPEGECCPRCGVDCRTVRCAMPECEGDMFVPEGECCPRCEVDCSAVSCLRPDCDGDMHVPEGECCPICGMDCSLVDCADKECKVDTEIPEGECCPVCPCDDVYCTLEVCGEDQIEIYLEGNCCKTCVDDCSTVRCRNPCEEDETPVRKEGGSCCEFECVPDCDNIVNCLVNPCDVTKCPSFPEATCVPDYCGGCNANFFIGDKKVENCHCDRAYCTLDVCNKNERAIFKDGDCCKTCEVCETICEIACPNGYDQLDTNCCPICNAVDCPVKCKEDEREVRREDGSIDCVPCVCFADPCQVNECKSFPEAECIADLCSCSADFYIDNYKIENCDCSDTVCPDFDESDPCIIKAEFGGECCPYYAIIDCAYPECAVEPVTREGECCPYCPCDLLRCYEPTDCPYGYVNENTCCRQCREGPDCSEVECADRECRVDFEEREGECCPFCPCDAVRCGTPPDCGDGVGFHHVEGEGCCSYECDDKCDRILCKDIKCDVGYRKVVPDGACCPVCEVRHIRYVISMIVKSRPDLSVTELKELICSLDGVDCTKKIIQFLIHKHKNEHGNRKRAEELNIYDFTFNTTDTDIIKILKDSQNVLAERGVEIQHDSISIATDDSAFLVLDETNTTIYVVSIIAFAMLILSIILMGLVIKRVYFQQEKEIIPLEDFYDSEYIK